MNKRSEALLRSRKGKKLLLRAYVDSHQKNESWFRRVLNWCRSIRPDKYN